MSIGEWVLAGFSVAIFLVSVAFIIASYRR